MRQSSWLPASYVSAVALSAFCYSTTLTVSHLVVCFCGSKVGDLVTLNGQNMLAVVYKKVGSANTQRSHYACCSTLCRRVPVGQKGSSQMFSFIHKTAKSHFCHHLWDLGEYALNLQLILVVSENQRKELPFLYGVRQLNDSRFFCFVTKHVLDRILIAIHCKRLCGKNWNITLFGQYVTTDGQLKNSRLLQNLWMLVDRGHSLQFHLLTFLKLLTTSLLHIKPCIVRTLRVLQGSNFAT